MFPYIGTGLDMAGQNLEQGGPSYYPGNTVAGFSDPQQKAMTGLFDAGMNGSPGLKAAGSFDTSLLKSGATNPWEDAMFTHAAQMSQPELQSEFAQSGADLAGAMPQRSQELNDLSNSFYGNEYQNNIQDKLEAGNQVQSLYNTRLGGLNSALGVGGMAQDQAQKLINADQQKYNFYQNKPQQNLMSYLQAIFAGNPGSQTNTPYFTNPTANALGVGSSLAGIYAMLRDSGTATAT
jgi:hypothetical protein